MKNRYIVSIFLLISQACSSDFLDLTDPNAVTADEFYKNEKQVEQAVNGTYGILQNIILSQYELNELPSDNTTVHIDVQDRGQVDRVWAMDLWTYEASNFNINRIYNLTYNALHNINTVLKRMENATLSQTKRDQFKGELLFQRAYHYYNLVQYFGDAVLLTEPVTSPAESYTIGRSPVQEVYSQIIRDLIEASTLLPARNSLAGRDKGRASQGAANALLGKVYLTLKDYPNAIAALRRVQGQGYALLPNYGDIFVPSNKNHVESIFEVQFQGGNNLGEHSNFIYQWAPLRSQGVITGFPAIATNGYNVPTRSMIRAFETGDKRKDVSLKEGYFNLAGQWVPIPYINKFNHPHTVPGRTDDNWPVLRYADVLLMLAEAINEQGGPTGEAVGFLNEVRTRAGLAPLAGLNQTDFRNAVMRERRVELCFENHRWFDLKRTMAISELTQFLNLHGQEERTNPAETRSGLPFNSNDYQFQNFKALFPIPDRQVVLSPAINQNPGY